jgi:D-tyrosyl-tRNA(Tyr) deacylase
VEGGTARALEIAVRNSKLRAMRVLLQRVSRAQVTVQGCETGRIDRGYLALVGFTHGDGDEHVAWMADKVVGLRLFSDPEGKMNLGITEVGGSILVVSQFTLYGDAQKGRRPSFIQAAHPEAAVPLYEKFIGALRERAVNVATGEFGADMQVELVNDGPVTLWLER